MRGTKRRARNIVATAVAVGVLSALPLPLLAHHTGSTIYSAETITLKGTVKSWLWSNPHCLLTIEVTAEDGKVVQWLAELQAPNSIYLSGYRRNSFKPGDEVTLVMNPAANGEHHGRLAQTVLADGTTLGSRGSGR